MTGKKKITPCSFHDIDWGLLFKFGFMSVFKSTRNNFCYRSFDAATADLKNANNAKKVKSLSQAIQSYEETLAILRILFVI